MEILKSFLVGSCAFFSEFEDFKPHDKDVVVFVDTLPNDCKFAYTHYKHTEYFIRKKMPKFDHIKFLLSTGRSRNLCELLVPEIARYFSITIQNLVLLKYSFEHMDYTHKYLTLIYNYYVENNDFYLTDEQLQNVYDEYKKERETKPENIKDSKLSIDELKTIYEFLND